MLSRTYDYNLNIYYEDGRLLSGLLSSSIYLLLAFSLWNAIVSSKFVGFEPASANQPTVLLGLFGWVTVGALAVGFLMAFSRFDSFFAIAYSTIASSGWILYLMTWMVTEPEVATLIDKDFPALQARAYLLLLEIVNGFAFMGGADPEPSPYVAFFGVSQLIWWITFTGIWAIFRHGQTWRAVVPTGIVLLIIHYYTAHSTTLPLITFTILAFVLLTQTEMSARQRDWRRRRVYFESDFSRQFWRNGFIYGIGLIVTIGVISIWSIPSLGSSPRVRGFIGSITQQWQPASEWRLDSGRSLGNTPIFQATIRSGQSARYWRGFSYDTYTGTGWSTSSSSTIEVDPNERIPAANWAGRTPLTQTVTVLASTRQVLYAVPDVIQASVPLKSAFNPLAAAPMDVKVNQHSLPDDQVIELTAPRTTELLATGDSYTVVSWQTQVTPQLLEAAGTNYPSETFVSRYTQLPESFSDQVRQTAIAQTTGATTVYEKAIQLEAYLRGFEYDESIPAPPDGADPIEYFLYDIQRGYCDYYATAMVTMLRSLGIPARPARGYAEGALTPASGPDGSPLMLTDESAKTYLLTERDAHAWVEVYFPRYGWIEFEPTAGESQLQRAEDSTAVVAASQPTAVLTVMPTVSSSDGNPTLIPETSTPKSAQDTFAPSVDSGLPPQVWWALFGALLGILIGGWPLLRRYRNRTPGEPMPASMDAPPDLPLQLFVRMHWWASWLGLSASETKTPYEQAQRLSKDIPQGRTAIERITESYVRYQYRQQSASSQNDLLVEQHPSLHTESADFPVNPPSEIELTKLWRKLRTLFIKAWSAKHLRRAEQKKDSHFTLLR